MMSMCGSPIHRGGGKGEIIGVRWGLWGGGAAGKQGGGGTHPFCGLAGVGVWRRRLSPELGFSGDNGGG
jgi:hypothetical protein